MRFVLRCCFPLSFGLGLAILFCTWPAKTSAQDRPGSVGHSFPVDEAIKQLERIHHTRIFYDPAWFAGDSILRGLLAVPLGEALETLLAGKDIDAISLHGNYLLLPGEQAVAYLEEDPSRGKLIGNALEYGRYARAAVSGRITDGLTDEELVGVLVYVEDLGLGTTTDFHGIYSLELPVGEHELRINYVGYEPYRVGINLVSPGELDVRLMSESRLLDVVTITARRRDSNISQTQMSLIRMDSRDLSQLPTTMGERDIIQSLTLLPGIQSVGEFGTGFHVGGEVQTRT
jgi:hypothetical protein